MDKEHLTFIDEDGNEILCEILFTFDSEMFKKSYVLFYPVSENEEDNIEVMAASFVPGKDGDGELFPIETDEEWELIERVLKQYEEDNAEEFDYEDEDEDEEEDYCEDCDDEDDFEDDEDD